MKDEKLTEEELDKLVKEEVKAHKALMIALALPGHIKDSVFA